MNIKYLSNQLKSMQIGKYIRKEILYEYFQHIFNNLSPNGKHCPLSNLFVYLNLPMILSKNIFREFKAEEKLLFEANFVNGMLKFYFGEMEDALQIFFNLFKLQTTDQIIIINDVCLAFKHLASNPDEINNFEKSINKFIKKTGNTIDFQNFQNYIFYEDCTIIINFFKLIYNRKPFTAKSLEFFNRFICKQEILNLSYSTCDTDENLISPYEDEDSDYKHLTMENKIRKFYILSNRKLKKCKANIIDTNIFVYETRSIGDSKVSLLLKIIPVNIYFIRIGDAYVNTKNFYFVEFKNKFSYGDNNTFTFYFKEIYEYSNFLCLINFSDKAKDFVKNYDFIKRIGTGSYGTVYLVKKLSSLEKFAVKIIKKPIKTNYNNILYEIEVLKFLQKNPHKNVIKIFDIFEDSGNFYVLMEYFPKNLTRITLKETLNDAQNSFITYQIADGLKFLHSNGIIHRDIKPDNILIERNEKKIVQVKIIDFGFSKVLFNEEKTNESFYTLIYAAPEILKKHSYDFKVDVWSFGILVYNLFYRKYPFINNNKIDTVSSVELIEQITNCNITLVKMRPLEKNIELLLKKCLINNAVCRNSLHCSK